MIAFPKNLHLMLFLSFSVNYAVNSIKKCVRQLNVRIWEHTVISLLTRKEVKPKGSCNSDHIFLCNYSPSFDSLKTERKSFNNER